jgi:hypothetical protein
MIKKFKLLQIEMRPRIQNNDTLKNDRMTISKMTLGTIMLTRTENKF